MEAGDHRRRRLIAPLPCSAGGVYHQSEGEAIYGLALWCFRIAVLTSLAWSLVGPDVRRPRGSVLDKHVYSALPAGGYNEQAPFIWIGVMGGVAFPALRRALTRGFVFQQRTNGLT